VATRDGDEEGLDSRFMAAVDGLDVQFSPGHARQRFGFQRPMADAHRGGGKGGNWVQPSVDQQKRPDQGLAAKPLANEAADTRWQYGAERAPVRSGGPSDGTLFMRQSPFLTLGRRGLRALRIVGFRSP